MGLYQDAGNGRGRDSRDLVVAARAPGSFMVTDRDGNQILSDQHR